MIEKQRWILHEKRAGMGKKLRLPMGIEDFERMRTDDFYYVDKTKMIKELLDRLALVNLFTRPRRFGKTLNMSMLKHFFQIGCDSTLFDGLEIAKERELCEQYMGKFPVISISLKNAANGSFADAKGKLCSIIGSEASRFPFLEHSDRLTENERNQYKKIIRLNDDGEFEMSGGLLEDSLLILSQLLYKHYGQKTVILIDEYDVPLDYAYRSGYYDDMVGLIRGLFGAVLKTNNSLYLAVLTGCLRISKESIFTGLNNFNVYTVKDVLYNECFGFTDLEVREMLEYYGLTGQYEAIKEWYDGYNFGGVGIYCPWDVTKCCDDMRSLIVHKANHDYQGGGSSPGDESSPYDNAAGGNAAKPKNYWVNTSSNDIIRRFINKADSVTRDEIEKLIGGGSVRKKIRQELTYRDLDSKIDNLWSILFTTGYLTQSGEDDEGMTELVIPNREIQWVYEEQIMDWFEEETRRDTGKLEEFCMAFAKNDAVAIEKGFTSYLKKIISIRDTGIRKGMKENFYHGILLGLLVNMRDWRVKSNAESGDGYSDISIEIDDGEIGIIIELKYAENAAFDAACKEALKQIRDRNYEEVLLDDGMKTIYRYGIACYKKRCKVVSG